VRVLLAVALFLAWVGLSLAQPVPNNGSLLVPNTAPGSGGGGSGTVTDVSWVGGIVSIASPTTTPSFTITGTSGGIPYFSSTSTWASSALLVANALMVGGGAGAAPSTITTGANVLTALGAAINASTGLPNIDGSIVTGDCLKWGPGIEDAGAACGSGGSTTLTVGSTATNGGAAGQLMYDTGSVLTESANLKFATGLLINGATLPTNAALALAYSPGANTATPGLAVINANLASSGNQQEACSLLAGQGWKTATTAASQEVDWQICDLPVQGTSAPTGTLNFLSQINGGGYTVLDSVLSTGDIQFPNNNTTAPPSNGSPGIGNWANTLGFFSGGALGLTLNSATANFSNGVVVSWNSDTGLYRASAGVLDLGNGTSSSVTGQLKLAGIIIASTVPTSVFAGGTCAGGSLAGGATAGTATLTGACAATNTWTLSVMPTAPTGYSCDADDRTTPAALVQQTSTSATTAVFTFSGTTGATDVLQYKCVAY
jgi:hypothetical protein